MNTKLARVCEAFQLPGTFTSYEEITIGNVNRTYLVNLTRDDGAERTYMVQALNTFAFKDPVAVMDNVDRITKHIREKKPGYTVLKFYHVPSGESYFLDGPFFWRVFNYIPSVTHNICTDLTVVRNAGFAFGEFQTMLADFDPRLLHETIPNFHNTSDRYRQLEETVAADPVGRVAQVQEELDWLFSVKEQACRLITMEQEGRLPLRVTHNDTKINNVLFDTDGREALVVIDLDTVMPGLVGFDYGDAIRSAANLVEEDSPETDKVGLNMDIFRSFTQGFLSQTASILTRDEVDTLALSCFVLTTELAVRFLTDYIQGNLYFKTRYPEHNLVRTRNQIALAKDMLNKQGEMDAIIRSCMDKSC